MSGKMSKLGNAIMADMKGIDRRITLWTLISIISIISWFLLQKPSLSAHFALIIWVFTGFMVLYLARNKDLGRKITDREKLVAYVFGVFFCVFSFVLIPLGLGNPPYSIGDFSILVSGVTLIVFANIGRTKLLLTSSVPLAAVLSFQLYDKARMALETLAEPLIPPVVNISSFFLNLLGVDAFAGDGNRIVFTSAAGDLIGVPVVFDCTGVESMGTFLLAAAVVFYMFRDMPVKKKLIFLSIGMIGTYLSNIMRVVIICMSGYHYGVGGMMELTHIHAGWVMFTVWMFVFWYAFFISYMKGQKKK